MTSQRMTGFVRLWLIGGLIALLAGAGLTSPVAVFAQDPSENEKKEEGAESAEDQNGQSEEDKKAEEARKAEEVRKAEEAKRAEAAKAAASQRAADALKRAEASKAARLKAAGAKNAPKPGEAKPVNGKVVEAGAEKKDEPQEGDSLEPPAPGTPARVTRPRPGTSAAEAEKKKKVDDMKLRLQNRPNSRVPAEAKAAVDEYIKGSGEEPPADDVPMEKGQEPTAEEGGAAQPVKPPVTPSRKPAVRTVPPKPAAAVDPVKVDEGEGAEKKEEPAAPPSRPASTRPGKSGRTPAQPADEEKNHQTPSLHEVEAIDSDVPPEERKYSFSIKNGTYQQLVDAFSRMTGLPVLGQAPQGEVTFVSTQEMSFKEAIGKVRMLLFKSSAIQPYWLRYHAKDRYLEVAMVNDLGRELERDHMFASKEAFFAAGLPDEELAFVLYTPKSVSTSVLEQVNLQMPDYVRSARLPDTNTITIFALVRDVYKYFELIDFFIEAIKDDPRVLEKIAVNYIAPTVVVEKLRQLMDLEGGVAAAPRASGGGKRGGAPAEPLAAMPEPPVLLLPDDDQQVIFVRAMPHKIDEIKEVLPLIDVDTSDKAGELVIIPVQNADAGQLVETIRMILGASEAQPAAAPKAPKGAKGKGAAAAAAAPAMRTVKADDITMIPYPPTNSIIVIAPEEGVQRVRELVERFDMEDQVGPVRVELEHADAEMASVQLTTLLSGRSPNPPMITPDPLGGAIWVTGTQRQITKVNEYLAYVDLPSTEVVLHDYHPKNQKPTFLAQMLMEYQGEAANAAPVVPQPPAPAGEKGGKQPSKARSTGKRPRRASASVTPAKFTPIDEENILLVWCSEEEWARYEPLLRQLDEIERPDPELTRIAVVHIAPADAITQLTELSPVFTEGGASPIRYAAADGAILFYGATEGQLRQIRGILAEIDHPLELIQRTFPLKHADPEAMVQLIETFVGGAQGGKAPKRGSSVIRKKPEGEPKEGGPPAPPQPVVATTSEDLTILRMGDSLVVKTTPAKMDEIAAVIAQFDVPGPDTSITRTYDFPVGADIENVAGTLRSVFTGVTVGPEKGVKGRPTAGAPMFISQPASHRLVVLAEEKQFADIEELMNVLKDGNSAVQIVTAFLPVQHAVPAEVVEMIEPLLRVSIKNLIVEGALEEQAMEAPQGGGNAPSKRPGGPARSASNRSSDGLHLIPDPRNHRIVIAAPQVVIDEARSLVADFDIPRAGGPSQLKRVALKSAEPAEVVAAIRGLMGKPTGVAKTGKKIEAKPGSAAPAASADGGFSPQEDFTIVEAPGGGAVLLHGIERDIADAEALIAKIDGDEGALQIKAFVLLHANLDDLAEMIMHVVDPPDARAGPGKAPKGGGAAAAADEDDGFDFETKKTYVGKSVLLKTDDIAGRMMVSAPPAKMLRIERIIEQFEGKVEEIAIEEFTDEPELPTILYKLEHKSAYSASSDLEMVLDAVWTPKNKLPVVDYIPFEEMLIVKHPDKDRLPEVEALIRKYVDVPDKEDTEVRRHTFSLPAGISAEDAVLYIKDRYPDANLQLFNIGTEPDFVGPTVIGPPRKKASAAEPNGKPAPASNGTNGTNGTNGAKSGKGAKGAKGDAKPTPTDRPQVNPCILPLSLTRSAQVILATIPAQNEEEQPQGDEQPVEEQVEPMISAAEAAAAHALLQEPAPRRRGSSGSSGSGFMGGIMNSLLGDDESSVRSSWPAKSLKGTDIKVYYDPESGSIVVESERSALDTIEDDLKDIEKELGKESKPDIRVVRVVYIDVNTAADLLDQVINAAAREQAAMVRQQMQQQQAQAQAQARAAAAAAARNAAQGNKGGEAGKGDEKGGEKGGQQPGAQPPQGPQMQMPAMSGVTIVPNPRDRSLILKAATRDYPAIFELLATIDQPQPITYEMRTYRLKKLNAAEVEESLKEMLGLDQATAGRTAQPAGGQAAPPGGAARRRSSGGGSGAQPLPQQIMQDSATGGEALGVFPADISIRSSDTSNTIVAMAPVAALDYIGKIIDELEGQEIPERQTRHFELQHADAQGVSDYLTNLFSESGGGGAPAAPGQGRGGRRRPATTSLTAPTFLPYPLLSLVTVQATEEDMKEIESVVKLLDVSDSDTQYEAVRVPETGADVMATLLTQMYAEGAAPRGGRGAQAAANGPKFVGAEGSDVLFYTAPVNLREQIVATIKRIEDEKAEGTKRYIIELLYAKPSDVAAAVESAYGTGGGSGGSARGGGAARRTRGSSTGGKFTIAAHDPTKRVFITARDEETKNEIESLVKSLDKPRKIGFDFRIYPLKYANARAVHGTLKTLVTSYIQSIRGAGAGGDIEPFSVEVDDKANALIVLGSATVFEFLEENLPKVDNPLNKASEPVYFMIALKNAKAQDVANSVNNLWRQRQLPPGQTVPLVEANVQLNVVIVRGTQEQVDEINNNVIKPLEEYTPPALKTETITLVYAQPESVAESINRIFLDKQEALRRLNVQNANPMLSTVVVTPEVNTKQIIVQASEENMAVIKARVAELDREDVALVSSTSVKVYPLQFADPASVANVITQWSQARTQGTATGSRTVAAREQVRAVVESGTHSVVATASEANHVIIKQMIEQIDVESTVKKDFYVVKLENAGAEDVARSLTSVYAGRRATIAGEQPVKIVADVPTNSLLITANKAEKEELDKLIVTLDVPPEVGRQKQLKSFKLLYAEAWSVYEAITQMFQATGTSPRDKVVAVPDWGSNSVIVSASPENITRVEELIKQLDQTGGGQRAVHLLTLAHADAASVARALDAIYIRSAQGGRRGEQPIAISAIEGTKAIAVKASDIDFEKIKTTVEELDRETFKAGSEIRVVELLKSDPAQVVLALTEAIRRPGSGRGTELPGDVRVSALAASSSIVISGEKTEVERIEAIVKQMDEAGTANRPPVEIKLVNADAAQILPKLEQMFTVEGAVRRRPDQQAPVILVDEATNSLIVRAMASDLDAIQDAVALFDTADRKTVSPIKIIPVKSGINVVDLAEKLQSAFETSIEATRSTTSRGRGGVPQTISIQPDRRTNSLIVSGTPSLFDEVEQVAQSMQDKGPAGEKTTGILRPTKLSAQDLANLIEQLQNPEGGSTRSGGSTNNRRSNRPTNRGGRP